MEAGKTESWPQLSILLQHSFHLSIPFNNGSDTLQTDLTGAQKAPGSEKEDMSEHSTPRKSWVAQWLLLSKLA